MKSKVSAPGFKFFAAVMLWFLSVPARGAETGLAAYHELRIYTVTSNKMDGVLERFRETVEPVRRKHGIKTVGNWTDGNDRFICLLAGESVDAIHKAITAFHQDPEWQRVEKETERDEKLRSKVEAFKMTPADFSALK